MIFPKPKHIILFGGSPLLVSLAKMLRDRDYTLDIFTAPRQEAEPIGAHGETLGEMLSKAGMDWYQTSNDINEDLQAGIIDGTTLGIGLGEAWSFKQPLLDAFNGRLLDFMGIPLPMYRGGAHYTWAIMNQQQKWGCSLQVVTKNTVQGEHDDGEIICQAFYEVPPMSIIPADWFDTCNGMELGFLMAFFDKVESGFDFQPTMPNEKRSLFFPRLNTAQNGWMNWAWQCQEIADFVNAFDHPYPGAQTSLEGRTVTLRGADTYSGYFHPFAAGLIVRKEGSRIVVATNGGTLHIEQVWCDGKQINEALKPGMRFMTSAAQLERAMSYVPNFTPSGDSVSSPPERMIGGKKVTLRQLTLADCNERYLSWMNDPEVNKYLESRFETQTIDSLRRFVTSMQKSGINYAFAIIHNETKQHIGNIKIGNVNYHHHYADIGYFIGERDLWGQGLATEAISLATTYAFTILDIVHLRAGVYETNVGSMKALRKAGYAYQGMWEVQLQGEKGREGHCWFTKTSPVAMGVA